MDVCTCAVPDLHIVYLNGRVCTMCADCFYLVAEDASLVDPGLDSIVPLEPLLKSR